MSQITVYKNRGITKLFQIVDAAEEIIIPDPSDEIRAVIGRVGQLGTNLVNAELIVASTAATANGSEFLKNTPSNGLQKLRLDAQDLILIPAGIYTLFLDYFDYADASEWKHADRHTLIIQKTE